MALIPCPECGREISTHATACPSCGYPIAKSPAAPPSTEQSALQSPQVWSRGLLALGAWLITPWIARLVVAIVALVVAYFMFRGH